MARAIDALPTPAHVKPKKLIVLSAPRTGTHGLYEALKKLGHRPYHMVEVVGGGVPAIRTVIEAMKAEYFHEGTPYGREEFDKWFADYDIIIEMPFFMLRSILKAYPDATFMLIERDPEKWAKSFFNSIGVASTRLNQLPMSVFKYFDSFIYNMDTYSARMVSYWTNGFGVSDKGRESLIENYSAYIAEVKRLVPPAQLKVFSLEDGFGWNDLCPYLGEPIPDTPWPSLNTPDEFFSLAKPMFQKAVTKGMVGVTTVIAIAAVGMGMAWKIYMSSLT
ncbi:P-loop containing nucleoside triphosphate hydrolase protein [Xylaria bambusicola]|uniref:P-loop containing nucleoside triphosphate hydrolase protein n=1 Tax=Xylaria bambusicola TaxID=326684 RepID=UPI00200767D9|nr:P-loop containing nucleoside triphosphate hydrolase protein [Xylaria bambusicola]KAI0506423.1 P-loop containing nucleoside triphosphate hydrolase protein [Xylaria bambusicola]